jgi:hypothetical protein
MYYITVEGLDFKSSLLCNDPATDDLEPEKAFSFPVITTVP